MRERRSETSKATESTNGCVESASKLFTTNTLTADTADSEVRILVKATFSLAKRGKVIGSMNPMTLRGKHPSCIEVHGQQRMGFFVASSLKGRPR
jgi:hypothetical protein